MSRHTSPRRVLGALSSLTPLVLLGAACGGDDDALPKSVEIVATDYAFAQVPKRIGTDTKVTIRNDSSVEVHELVAFPLPDDVTGTASEILARPEAELDEFLDVPPSLVVVAGPNETSFVAVGEGTLPKPGRYLLLCAIPTGANAAELMAAAASSDGPPDVAGGPPHFVHGMAATVEVVDS